MFLKSIKKENLRHFCYKYTAKLPFNGDLLLQLNTRYDENSLNRNQHKLMKFAF